MSEKTSEIPKEWNHSAFDAKGKVICQVCGKSFMILTPSHLKTHDVKYSEYNNKFPGAPITTEEFKALSKYSKPSKYTEEDMKILGKETVIEDDIPVIDDDFEIPKIHVAKKFDNPMDAKKNEIFSFLIDFLPNLKMDHLIEVKDIQNILIFSTISDFADPFLKINLQFPDTFWHNVANWEDPNRDAKLQENGWKIITVKSTSPKIKAIEKKLREII
jgi:very-short-patch-repair endonuclease